MYPLIQDNWMLYKTPEGGDLLYGAVPIEKLNATGASILELCDGIHELGEIFQILAAKYDDELKRVQSLVQRFLEDSGERGIVKVREKDTSRKRFVSGNSSIWVPYYVSIETTKRCDLMCIHCYAGGSPAKSWEAPPTKWIEILKEFYDLGTLTVNLTGGDPLAYEGIFDILDYCEGRFLVTLPTNGFRIDAEIALRLSEYKCIEHIQISLDGPDAQTHDAIRGRRGSFERATRAIELLAKNPALNLHVGMVILPQNEDCVEDTIRLAKDLGANVFGAGRIFSIGRAKEKFNLTKEKLVQLDSMVSDLSRKHSNENFIVRRRDAGAFDPSLNHDQLTPDEILQLGDLISTMMGGNCGAGYRSIYVSSIGDVYPCGMMEMVIGNVIKYGVRQILKSPLIQESFRTIRSPNSEICGNCENRLLCSGCIAQAYANSEHEICSWRNRYDKFLSFTE